MVCIIRALRAANDVSPVNADLVTRLDVDDFARHGGLEARFAGDVCIVDVGDRVVGGGDADADGLAIVLAVDTAKN